MELIHIGLLHCIWDISLQYLISPDMADCSKEMQENGLQTKISQAKKEDKKKMYLIC